MGHAAPPCLGMAATCRLHSSGSAAAARPNQRRSATSAAPCCAAASPCTPCTARPAHQQPPPPPPHNLTSPNSRSILSSSGSFTTRRLARLRWKVMTRGSGDRLRGGGRPYCSGSGHVVTQHNTVYDAATLRNDWRASPSTHGSPVLSQFAQPTAVRCPYTPPQPPYSLPPPPPQHPPARTASCGTGARRGGPGRCARPP